MSDKAASIFSVTEEDFESTVVERSRAIPVVVDFWAPWCGPCTQLTPILERLVEQRAGQVLLAKVNIDEEQELAARFGVNSIPTVIAFRDGQAVLDFVGVLPERQLAEFLDRLVPTAADRKARDAGALETGDPAQAEKLYREALKEDLHHEQAILGLARLLLQHGDGSEASELLDRVGVAGVHGNEVERLRAILWLRQQAQGFGDGKSLREKLEIDCDRPQILYELGCVVAGEGKYPEALDLLYRAAATDRKLAGSVVRETMVKIFHAIGVRSPLADEFRDKLRSLLY